MEEERITQAEKAARSAELTCPARPSGDLGNGCVTVGRSSTSLSFSLPRGTARMSDSCPGCQMR